LCHIEAVSDEQPNFRMQWLVLLLFVFAVALAVVWMLAEVKRVKHIRELSNPPAAAATAVSTNR
jgi:hypothetical protein